MPDVEGAAEVGLRLKLLREALKMSQTALCRLTGITPQAWNNAETGDNFLTVTNAMKLCRVTGVTMDWIYRGQITSALPAVLLEEIQRQQLLQQSRNVTNFRPHKKAR